MHSIPNDEDVAIKPLAILYKTDVDADADATNGVGWISGCDLTAQGTPDMTRALSSGSIQVGGVVVSVSGQNTPTVTADGTSPRWVIYEINSSGTVFVISGTPATTPIMPSRTSGRVVVGADYVAANATSLTGAISRDMRFKAASLVTSVHGQVGAVTLTYSDVGADASGAASTVNTSLSNHLSDTIDAHDASAISFVPAGNIAAIEVQAAIQELDSEKSGTGHNHSGTYDPAGSASAVNTALTDHLNDTSDAHDASAISFVPAGNIAATTAQAAIEELDTEKSSTSHNHSGTYDPAGTSSTHAALTAAHGATGAVVGTTNTQTLTNKTLTAPVIADFTSMAHDHLDTDDGGTLTAAAVSDFDTQVRTSRLDQMAVPTASVSLNSQKITSLAAATASTDAVSKTYMESNAPVTVQVSGSDIGTRHKLNFASTSIQASAVDNSGTGAVDITLNLPQFGSILVGGHSYTQVGGENPSYLTGGGVGVGGADRFVCWSHIVPAALKIPDGEIKLWGKSAAAICSANSTSTNDVVGSGTYMRQVFPTSWYNGDSASKTIGDVVTNDTTLITSATADFKSTDAGKYITGTGIASGTRINSVTSATNIILSAATSGGGGSGRTIVWGTVKTSGKQLPSLNVLMYGHNENRWAYAGAYDGNGSEIAMNAYKNGVRAVSSRLMASEVYNSLHPLVVKTGSWSAITSDSIQTGTQYVKTTTNADTIAVTIPPWSKGGTIGVNFIGCTNFPTMLAGGGVNTTATAWTLSAGSLYGYKNIVNGDLLIVEKGLANEEYVLVTAGGGTTSITVTRSRTITGGAGGAVVTHASGVNIQLPTTTARVTTSVSGDGKLNGSTNTDTIYLAGQGAAKDGVLTSGYKTRVHVCKRFVTSRADAGKTITFTTAGIVGNEEVAFDAYWIEDPVATHTLWINQPPTIGQAGNNYPTQAFWTTVNTALSDVVAEFPSNVAVVDVNTKWKNIYNGTWRSDTGTSTTGAPSYTDTVTFWPYDDTLCRVDVGSVLRSESEEMIVTGITKTSSTNWDLTVNRQYLGVGGGLGSAYSAALSNHTGSSTRASGHEVGDQLPMSVDRIHPSNEGHVVIATAVLEKLATLSQTSYQIASSGAVVGRRNKSYLNGQYLYPPHGAKANSTATTQSRAYAIPLKIETDCVMTSMSVEVSTSAASSVVRMGVYLDQAGRPGTRVADLGTVASTATGTKTINCYTPLKPGWYWFVVCPQGGAPTIRYYTAANRLYEVQIPTTDIGDIFTAGNSGANLAAMTQESVTGELPVVGSFIVPTGGTGAVCPFFAIKVDAPETD